MPSLTRDVQKRNQVGENMMDKRNVERLVNAARDYAPVIESALGGLKDSDIRAAIAGAVMVRLLDEVSVDESGRRPPVGSRSTERRKTAKDGDPSLSGTQARIMELGVEAFFAEPRSAEQVRAEMATMGRHHGRTDINMGLLRLVRKKMLRRIATGARRGKTTFAYVRP